MEDTSSKLFKFLCNLAENDRIDAINKTFDMLNLNLSNARVLQLKAPARLMTSSRKSYIICLCGHDYKAHALDEIWENGGCRFSDCKCEKFEG